MNPRTFKNYAILKKDTYENLKEEYDYIKKDISTIKNLKISEEAKQLPLQELKKKADEIKERMHNFIDTL